MDAYKQYMPFYTHCLISSRYGFVNDVIHYFNIFLITILRNIFLKVTNNNYILLYCNLTLCIAVCVRCVSAINPLKKLLHCKNCRVLSATTSTVQPLAVNYCLCFRFQWSMSVYACSLHIIE